jgi:hypothetical protein
MNKRRNAKIRAVSRLLAALALLPAALPAQVPVDEDGNVFSTYEAGQPSNATGNEDIPLLSAVDLDELVGPIALYPDDLLAIVLPASAYPLQIVDAARFLEAVKTDPSLQPDPEWDDSVVALLNYPEVVELLNEDIDWTWRLGEAVVAQQADVVATIEAFRDRAYAAGNLKSDDYQNVTHDNGVIEITPVSEDVIYVPYYEPDRVVVYQPRPVYYYYPRAYPVYYYPYSAAYRFDNYGFWGVTTAFRIGWFSDCLQVFHHSYNGHPYYGRQYRDRWWYRRPTISRHNVVYFGGNTDITINRYYGGDRWRPRVDRREYSDVRRVTRNRTDRIAPRRFPDGDGPRNFPRRSSSDSLRTIDSDRASSQRRQAATVRTKRTRTEREPITFRQRTNPQVSARPDVSIHRTPDVTQRNEQRSRRDVVQNRRPESRSRPLHTRSDSRDARLNTDRGKNIEFRSRTATRQAPARQENARPRRIEPSQKTVRATPGASSERRTSAVQKLQTRRQEPRARSDERQSRPASRPAPETRKTHTKPDSSQRKRVNRYSAKRD